jgi:hypothetical protein
VSIAKVVGNVAQYLGKPYRIWSLQLTGKIRIWDWTLTSVDDYRSISRQETLRALLEEFKATQHYLVRIYLCFRPVVYPDKGFHFYGPEVGLTKLMSGIQRSILT